MSNPTGSSGTGSERDPISAERSSQHPRFQAESTLAEGFSGRSDPARWGDADTTAEPLATARNRRFGGRCDHFVTTGAGRRIYAVWAVLVILLAVGAVLASAGKADASLPDRWQVMERIARATWPNACTPSYVVDPLMDESTFAESQTGEVFRGPDKGRKLCVITFNGERLKHELSKWPMFCRIGVHEWGHLAGRHHLFYGEATQIMYFSVTPEPWPGCESDWKTDPLRFMTDAQAAKIRICPTGRRYTVAQSRAKVCRHA